MVGADEQDEIDVDVDRWTRLARAVLETEQRRGELTLTFVDRDEIAELNAEHLGQDGPDRRAVVPARRRRRGTAGAARGIPVLLGDVVVCPAVAAEQAATHAGTLDDELALLVVHGVLHVLGHDHAEPDETATMRGPRARPAAAAPLGRPGAGRLPPGAGRLTGGSRPPDPRRDRRAGPALASWPSPRRASTGFSVQGRGHRPRRRRRGRALPMLGLVEHPSGSSTRCSLTVTVLQTRAGHLTHDPVRRPARRRLGRSSSASCSTPS